MSKESWIDPNITLPREGQRVYVNNGGCVYEGFYLSGRFEDDRIIFNNVTDWMPWYAPDPPKR